jgi:hypothetical protein
MENGKQSAFTGIVNEACQPGLTKREYFAGLAMQGLLSNANEHTVYLTDEGIVKSAIIMAEELLKQLDL